MPSSTDDYGPGPGPGPGVDAMGRPVIDPTRNVLDLVAAAIQRQDDLRNMQEQCRGEIDAMRERYEGLLREAEAKRIDAIRAVDVGAVNRAAEVSATQAATLAAQVATSAETLRTQVAAAASAQTLSLAAALDPIQKAIDDLRRTQYQQAGEKAQVVEARSAGADSRGANQYAVAIMGAVVGLVGLALAIAGFVVANSGR
jgi:cobalamin biosynthesis Mg chelatase CobN